MLHKCTRVVSPAVVHVNLHPLSLSALQRVDYMLCSPLSAMHLKARPDLQMSLQDLD